MQNREDIIRKIEVKFEGFQRDIQEYNEDIEKLANNMLLLEEYNLSRMNNRLIEQTKIPKFLEMLTEINFTAGLLKSNSISSTNVFYEREEGLNNVRPVDLEVLLDSRTYLMQIKQPSIGERQNRQNNIIREVQREITSVPIKKYFSLRLSRDFNDKNGLIEFLKEKAALNIDNDTFVFLGNQNSQATVKFYSPKNAILQHLTLGDYGDLLAMEISGETSSQLRNAIENAIGAFDIETNSSVINLVVMEVPRNDEIDFCEALFGTECIREDCLGRPGLARDSDGLFNDDKFKLQIFGVIGLIKKEKDSLVSDYEHVFLVNPHFRNEASNILNLIPNTKIIFCDTPVERSFGFV